MNIEEVNRLFDNGTLFKLYRSGFVSVVIFTARDVYNLVDLFMKVDEMKKDRAVLLTAKKMSISRDTVYRLLRKFK